MDTEIKEALSELSGTIRELGKIRDEMKKMQEEVVKKQEKMKTVKVDVKQVESELVKVQLEILNKETQMQKVLLAVSELKSLRFKFVDDQIKSRLGSNVEEIDSSFADRLLELESITSDTLDDVRLLLLENIKRGSGNEMLSVVKLCSDPIVKVISTKKNIQKNFIDSAKVVNLAKEKREQILDDSKVLTCGVLLESDILEVLNFPCNCPDPVTAVVKITTEPAKLPFVDYQVVLKSEKDWEIITAHSHEGYVELPHLRMKHLFVISREKWDSYTLSPGGLNYKSVDFEHVTVRFPPRSVSKKCEIKIQVIPPNLEEQEKCQDPNDDPYLDIDTDIVSVSPRLWVKHDDVLKFKKPIVVTLPLPPKSSTEEETDLCLIKWTDGDDVYISETSIRVKGDFCEFEVAGFSGCSAGRRRRRKRNGQIPYNIEDQYLHERGLSKECQILTLSDRSAVNTLWIEIVESSRVEDLLKLRLEQQQLVQIKNITYPTISVRYGQSINIFALGSIRINSNYETNYLRIKFTEREKNNFLRFQVEVIDTKSSAMLKFQLKKKKANYCHFEPNDWLRQRSETLQTTPEAESQRKTLITANKTLHIKSMLALARQIPIRQTEELAIELNLSYNEVADFKAHRYEGKQLAYEVLWKWLQKSDKEPSDMINELATALNNLSLKYMASKLLLASKERRSLVNEDFEG